MRIIIYDDDVKTQREWKDSLPLQFKVETPPPATLSEALEVLQERRGAARTRTSKPSSGKASVFDETDILIVDYDLCKLPGIGILTGEDVAYLVRCYSSCRIIVALNQFSDVDFDLALRGHLGSFADLNINATHLSQTGLWKQPWRGFRPWQWPLLPWAVAAHKARAGFLEERLDDAILNTLGLVDLLSMFPRSLIEFLTKKSPEKTTFREFVLDSGNGFRAKDEPLHDHAVARIAAARIWKWLERGVLPGQDLLVDAPHLAERCPAVLNGPPRKIASWDATLALLPNRPQGLRRKLVEPFRFQAKNWLSREVWLWPDVNAKAPPELLLPSQASQDEFVFCEDLSAFCRSEESLGFIADLRSSFTRRFVAGGSLRKKLMPASRLHYGPAVRLAIQ